jgi:hypothetical protein
MLCDVLLNFNLKKKRAVLLKVVIFLFKTRVVAHKSITPERKKKAVLLKKKKNLIPKLWDIKSKLSWTKTYKMAKRTKQKYMYTLYNENLIRAVAECIGNKQKIVSIKPKTSEASQFHQPPHVPSCNAHQLPKNKAKTLTARIRIKFLLIRKSSCSYIKILVV